MSLGNRQNIPFKLAIPQEPARRTVSKYRDGAIEFVPGTGIVRTSRPGTLQS